MESTQKAVWTNEHRVCAAGKRKAIPDDPDISEFKCYVYDYVKVMRSYSAIKIISLVSRLFC